MTDITDTTSSPPPSTDGTAGGGNAGDGNGKPRRFGRRRPGRKFGQSGPRTPRPANADDGTVARDSATAADISDAGNGNNADGAEDNIGNVQAAPRPPRNPQKRSRAPNAEGRNAARAAGDAGGQVRNKTPRQGKAGNGARGERAPKSRESGREQDASNDPSSVDNPAGDGSGKQRLHKALAQTGLGSRREMEGLIAEGQVQINGETAQVGQSVEPGDRVHVKRRKVNVKFGDDKPRVMIYHKPPGEIVSRDDPEGRPTVFDALKAPDHGKWIAVGRLDFNSEGLLIFTTYGELANRLMHPSYQVVREYSVRILGELTPEQEDQLIDGIELEDGPARVLSLEVEGGEGANRWYRLTLQEGRNREVRRMFEALGLTVSRLIRIRYGTLSMPSWLKRGQTKLLDEAETFELLTAVGLRSNSVRAQQKRAQKGESVPSAQIGVMRNAREHELARDGRGTEDPALRSRAGGGKARAGGGGKGRIDPLATSFGFDAPRGGGKFGNHAGNNFGGKRRGAVGVAGGAAAGAGARSPGSKRPKAVRGPDGFVDGNRAPTASRPGGKPAGKFAGKPPSKGPRVGGRGAKLGAPRMPREARDIRGDGMPTPKVAPKVEIVRKRSGAQLAAAAHASGEAGPPRARRTDDDNNS